MKNHLIVAWRKESNKQWFPIGILERLILGDRIEYSFSYTQGVLEAKNAGFTPLFGETKNEQLKNTIKSENLLFPVFANRVMTKSRPEYPKYKEWLDLQDENNPFEELAKNNGIRATDNLQVFAIPEKKNGKYIVDFFIHEFDFIDLAIQAKVGELKPKDTLYLAQDIQNPYDRDALLIRTENPLSLLGYVPRLYTKDFVYLLNQKDSQATLKILRTNPDAPLLYRVFCRFEAKWDKGFDPFAEEKKLL